MGADGRRDASDVQMASAAPLGLLRGVEGLITGTVVCAAVIAASVGHLESTVQAVTAMVGTVLVYWLAHLHAHAIGGAISEGHHPVLALRHAAAHTWTIAAASLVPVAILLLAEVFGADLSRAAWIALWSSVGLLAFYSYLAGARGGLGWGGRLACSLAGGALGLLVALLKASLH
jgi:hypothetical protein